jgi:tryptophan 2,3-dioxygenase
MQRKPIYYGDYLQLDKLLDAQKPISNEIGKPAHDENLFIIIHQVYELWFKQIITEVDSAIAVLKQDFIPESELNIVVHRLNRVCEIQRILIAQLKVIETMTPLDFLDFRDLLLPASGFQSIQFRLTEVKLGLKLKYRMGTEKKFFNSRLSEVDKEKLSKCEEEVSLFEAIEKWLERMPFHQFKDFNFWQLYKESVTKMLDHDEQIITENPTLNGREKEIEVKNMELTRNSFDSLFDDKKYQNLLDSGEKRLSHRATLSAIFIHLYRDEPLLNIPFRLLDSIVEIDENFTTWRNHHAIMAQRILGARIGTGGSSGHEYLKLAAENGRVFRDYFNIATFLIPRSLLPELPEMIKNNLRFNYKV